MEENQVQSKYILTADIGGSHITASVCNMEMLNTIADKTVRVEVQSKGSAGDILNAWVRALTKVVSLSKELPVSGLSIAMPGPFDYKNGISYIKGLNKYEALYGLNIRQYLAEALGFDPELVRFRNDAESTIAGEVLAGAGKQYQRVIGITLGTGFGSAFSDKKITKDLNLGSEPYGETIADDYFSTRWFLKRYYELTGVSPAGGVRELAVLAGKSPMASKVFKEFAVNVAGFLSKPIAQMKPDALIICGNIARAQDLFLPQLLKELNPLPAKTGSLDENAPLIGAAIMFGNVPVAP